jgi:LuxR family maltose regulon positive regulatory protein
VLWLKGQTGAIEAHLVDAERVLAQAEGVNADNIGLSSHLSVLRSIVARYHNDFETAGEFAERALRLVPENLPPQDNAQLHAVIFLALGAAYDGSGDFEKAVDAYTEAIRWSRIGTNAAGIAGMTYWLSGVLRLLGRLRAADEACRKALSYIQELGKVRLPVTGILHLTMGEMLLERNDLEAAEAHLSQAIELGKWSGRFDTVKNAAPALARLRQARHDSSGAHTAVWEAELAQGVPQSPLVRADLLALKARVLVQQGSLTEAAQCIEDAIHLAGQDRGQIGEKISLAAARVMVAHGKPEEAIVELTRSLTAAESSGRLGVAIEMRILRSLVFMRQGNIQEAEADLERALALAEPEGYIRIFIDEGQPMQMLLTQWLAHASVGPLQKYAIHLLTQFEAEVHIIPVIPAVQEKSSPAATLVDPLSQRELEVLHLISLGKTNQEIARQLIVAPGTVKAHTASIYRKLEVANRTESVARARQLGILP